MEPKDVVDKNMNGNYIEREDYKNKKENKGMRFQNAGFHNLLESNVSKVPSSL